MNKRISTLLAAALVAGGVSASATTSIGNMVTGVKTGDLVTLNAGKKFVSINESKLDFTKLADLVSGDAEAAFSGIWEITVIPSQETSGTPTYSFVNKLTGLPFAVELKTNNKGESTAVAAYDEDGETVWAFNSKLGLYHVTKDSTFFFGSGYRLKAVKGGLEAALAAGGASVVTPALVDEDLKLTLTPKIFNQITTSGKLFFSNKKDVLNPTIENYLKTQKWTAASAISGEGEDATDFILKVQGTETATKGPKVLVVDTAYYDIANKLHHMILDTLGTKPVYDKDGVLKADYANAKYCIVKKNGEEDKVIALRPIETASFRGEYFLANDSVVLYANYEPEAVDVEAIEAGDAIEAVAAFYTYNKKQYATFEEVKAAVNAAIDAAQLSSVNDVTKKVQAWKEAQNNSYKTYTVTYVEGVTKASEKYMFAGSNKGSLTKLQTAAKAVVNKLELSEAAKTAVNEQIDAWTAKSTEGYSIDVDVLSLTAAERTTLVEANIVGEYIPAVPATIPEKYVIEEEEYATFKAAQNAVITAVTTDAKKTADTRKSDVKKWKAEVASQQTSDKKFKVTYTAAVAGGEAIAAEPAYRGIQTKEVGENLGHIALTPLDANKIVITPAYDNNIESEELATAANFILPLIQPDYTLDLEDGRITVADDVYTIQNEEGRYLAVPIYTNGNLHEWVKLIDDFQNPDHMPAYQWVVLKDRKNNDKSAITLYNREYNTTIKAQLYLTEDNDTIATTEDYYLRQAKALTFNAVSASAKADSLLGYKNLDGESLPVLRYTFNHFSPYDATQYIGVSSKDSIMVVKDTKTSFTIHEHMLWDAEKGMNVLQHVHYGFNVTEDVAERIPGLKNLYRTAYYMTVKEPGHLNYGVYAPNKDDKFYVNKQPYEGGSLFYFKENNCDETSEYYALISTDSYCRAGVAENTKDATLKYTLYDDVNVSVFAIEVNDSPLYRTLYKADGSLAGVDTIKIFSQNNADEFLGVESNPAYMVKDINFLGLETAKSGVGYGLIADSVRVNRGYGYIKPQYLLSIDREVVVGEDAVPCPEHGFDPNCPHWTPGTASFVRAKFLVNTVDSVNAGKKEYTWSKNDKYIRPAFVDAIHMGDSLYILKDQFAGIETEKIDMAAIIKANNDSKTKGRYIIGLDSDAHKKCTFSFRFADPAAYADDAEKDAFLIESMPWYAGDDIAPSDAWWIRLQNNVIVIANEEFTGTWDDAMLFDLASLSEGDKLATDNETIATSEVTVIAGEGQVTIANAAGKKVVISNILGQTVANTVITSDNAVIAAPQGVVVVAVEGEKAVKAIVK